MMKWLSLYFVFPAKAGEPLVIAVKRFLFTFVQCCIAIVLHYE